MKKGRDRGRKGRVRMVLRERIKRKKREEKREI
jgi:hypothetical protein